MNDNLPIEDPYEGQKFSSFEVLKKYLEEYGKKNYVKFWIRSSHTINSLKSKISKKANPDLKYVCMKFACIFGGEKIRCRGSGIRKSSTYRNLGCPCMINAVIGDDGNHVKLDTVILEHNHALCKSLYDSVMKSRRRITRTASSGNTYQNGVVTNERTDESEDNFVMQDVTNLVVDKTIIVNDDETNICNELESELIDVDDSLKTIQEKYGGAVKIIVVDPVNNALEHSEMINSDGDEGLENDCSKLDSSNNELMEQDHEILKNKDVCRLCLTSGGKLSPIFDPNLPLESTILSFKIMGCASIEISSDDGLPKNICSTCEETLDIAYNFRIRCEKSDSILRKTCLTNSNQVQADGQEMYIYRDEDDVEKIEITAVQNQDCCEENAENLDYVSITDNKIVKNEELISKEDAVSNSISCSVLRQHTDNDALIYSCNKCNVMCATIDRLYEHMCEHLNETRVNNYAEDLHECPMCDLTFLNLNELKIHEQSHSNKDKESISETEKDSKNESTFLCNICGKILRTKERFQSHRNTHEGLRPHVCTECGKGFADRKNMHQHYDIVHLRKAKHECPVCQKKFYTPTKMKSHITMHYGVKPFTCDVCNKTFRLKMNMIKHKKTHSNDRPHQCDKCSAAFIDKNMLKRHSYIHGGVRPYPCPICGHRFSVRFHLKKHLEKSKCHGNSEYTADEWMGIAQSDLKMSGNECVMVHETNEENLLNEAENDQMNMDMLQEYDVEASS